MPRMQKNPVKVGRRQERQHVISRMPQPGPASGAGAEPEEGVVSGFLGPVTMDSQCLREQRGSGGHGEHPWMKQSMSPMWTGPFLAGTSGDTTGKGQCGWWQCPSKVPELFGRIKSAV